MSDTALMRDVTWTNERVALLKQYCRVGLSASMIGLRLNVTRDAVLGKMWRMGLKRHLTPRARRRQITAA